MKTLPVVLVMGFLLQSSSLCLAAPTVFSDGNFEEVHWEEEVLLRPPPDGDGNGTGSGTAMQEADPDPAPGDANDTYRHVYVIRDPDVAGSDVSTRLFSIARNAVFEPSSAGPISRVDVALFGRQFGSGSGGTVEPALQQGDTLYIAAGQSLPEQAWTLKDFPGLTESDFSEPGIPDSHPDFSVNGDAIHFGFSYVVSAPSDQAVESTAGFDDWEVAVNHAGGGEMLITAGINDAWFEAAADGQGFFITALPDNGIVFLSWFTYDTERPPAGVEANLGEPGHRWLTAQGPYSGNAALLDVYLTAGGVFDSAQPAPVTSDPIGTIVIVWQDCAHATLDYEIPGLELEGRIELERVAADNVALCQVLIGQ